MGLSKCSAKLTFGIIPVLKPQLFLFFHIFQVYNVDVNVVKELTMDSEILALSISTFQTSH